MKATDLKDCQRARGALFSAHDPDRVAGYGDLEAEALALQQATGLYERTGRRLHAVSGKDAADFLQRMLSQDVAKLAPGSGVLSCVLTPQGRILGMPLVWNVGDAFWLDLDAPDAAAYLERYVIADDVTFRDRTSDVVRFVLAGPGAPRVMEGLGVGGLEAGAQGELDGGVRALRVDWGGRPTYELVVPASAAAAFFERLGGLEGVTPVGDLAWSAWRVAAGVPAWGCEITPEVMPLEVALGERAVSWKKGCYPGQEPVSMARYRGHPPHLLVRVGLEGGRAPEPGELLHREGREVGRLTTVSPLDEGGPWPALALVRHGFAKAGEVFDAEHGGILRVLDVVEP